MAATMTKGTFIKAASMVHAVLSGDHPDRCPSWADADHYVPETPSGLFTADERYTRAVQLAEVFIQLFTNANPLFDADRFLTACGLCPHTSRPSRPHTQRRRATAHVSTS